MRRSLAALSVCLWGCGDNRPAPPDAATEVLFQPAPHAPMPIAFPHTGTVLSQVHLVVLKFTDYDAPFDLEAFGRKLVQSTWYKQIGAEYGVLAGTAELVDIGPAPASLGRADIAARITELIAADQVPRPVAFDSQVLYLLCVPPAVTRGADLTRSFHDMHALGDGVRFPFAVVLDGGGAAAETSKLAAHQVINAVTDPYGPPADGYYADPPRTDPWSLVRGELGDLCEGEAPVVEDGFAYSRVYSNRAAMASRPPCQPLQPDDAWSDVTAEPSQVQRIPAGGSVEFQLTGWSTSPVPDWQIRLLAADVSQLSLDDMTPQLSSASINNSTTVTLTLHAPRDASQGTIGGVSILSGESGHPWAVGFVVQ